MLSTKIRTTIIALVASASFAAATVVPTVSQAQPNWPALGHAIHCESLNAGQEANENKAKEAEKEGHPSLAAYYWSQAQDYFSEGIVAGCSPHAFNPTKVSVPIAATAPPAAKLP